MILDLPSHSIHENITIYCRDGETLGFLQSAKSACDKETGKWMVKEVPRPGSLLQSIHPRCCLTMPKTMDNPRPVPLPCSFVVKKGSKMEDLISGGIP